MKSLLTLLLGCFSAIVFSQTIANFENFGLLVDEHLNDAGDTGFFSSGNIDLPNVYDTEFDFWSGWAISSMTDQTSPGYLNQYSAITGEGYNSSKTYAVTYAPTGASQIFISDPLTQGYVSGFYITNSTYAYLSMLEGDAFAKKFGGASGNDPDFFKITVKKQLNGQLGTDSVEFYLADYRFSDNSQDYIVDEWTWLDLSSLGKADVLKITFSSSDVGTFGINTPTYFCLDNLVTTNVSPVSQVESGMLEMKVWPNPASEFLKIEWNGTKPTTACISSIYGQKLKEISLQIGQNEVEIASLPVGIFTLQILGSEIGDSTIFIKN